MDNTGGYSDLDLTFNVHPIKKDLMLTTGENAVSRSLKHLILTNHYEKPFHPDIGSNVRKILFELMTPFSASSLAKEIEFTINNYEPRVKLNKVTVTANYDYNAYDVSINFYIENMVQPFTAEFLLYRLR